MATLLKQPSGACRGAWVALALVLGLTYAGSGVHAGAAQLGDVQVRAAFLFNFARFVQWPQSSAPIVIGIVADRQLAAVTTETIKGRTIDGRPVDVRIIAAGGDPAGCDVLHFGALNDVDALQLLSRVKGPVVTVGETPRFLRDGGIVRVFIEDQRLRFQINNRHALDVGLRISSQLLSLAAQ